MSKNVLWVDDEIISIIPHIKALAQISSLKIENAMDVSTALKKLKGSDYDLLILDVIMPTGPIEDDYPFLNSHFESYQHNGGFGLLSVVLSNDWQRISGNRKRPQIIISSAYPRVSEEQIVLANLDHLKIVNRSCIRSFLHEMAAPRDPDLPSASVLTPVNGLRADDEQSAKEPTKANIREKLHELERHSRDVLNQLSQLSQFFLVASPAKAPGLAAQELLQDYLDSLSGIVDLMIDFNVEPTLVDLYEECFTSLKRHAEKSGAKEIQFILGDMLRLADHPIKVGKVATELASMQKSINKEVLFVSEI